MQLYSGGNNHAKSNGRIAGTLTYNDITFLVTSTAYGDGMYRVTSQLEKEGGYIGVDAGLICFVSKSDIEKKMNVDLSKRHDCMLIKNFSGGMRVDGKGNFSGSYRTKIKTS